MYHLRTYPLLICLLISKLLISQVVQNKQATIIEETQKKTFFTSSTSFRISKSPENNENKIQKLQKTHTSFLDTCATYTYRLKIGTDNSNEEVTEVTTLKSGEMLLTGKTDKNNFQDDALLIKLDKNGNVIWVKTFGENNKQEIFYKARETDDGGIITIGTAYDPGLATGFILICKMDGNGNLQWARKYKSAADMFDRGADIIQLSDNDFAFLGDNGKNLLYGKLSNAGNLLWDQEINASDSTRALNIVEDYDGWIIASAGMDTGWHVSNVFKVDTGNGNFIWRRRFGGSNANVNYIFQKMEFINLRPRITGIYSAPGQPYQFMRVNMNTTSIIESIEQYITPGITIDTTSNMVLTPWDEALAFSPNNKTGSISIFENYSDVPVTWAYSYTTASDLQIKSIEKTADAGFIAACTIINNSDNDILLIKVDSTGLSPGCEGSPFVILRNVTTPYIPNPSAVNSNEILTVDNNPIPANNILLDTLYSCRQLTCPVFPPEDTCLPTFYKNYRSYQFCDVTTSFSITDDDHIILSGVNRDNPYDASWQRAFIFKTDNEGNVVAEKRFAIGENCLILKQIKLNDNNILATGYFIQSGVAYGFFLLKLDKNLNVIWSKTYSLTLTSWQFADMAEAGDGSIFVGLFVYDFPNLNDRMILVKFDNTGNFLWQKLYRPSGAVSFFNTYGSLICSGPDIYFVSHMFFDTEQRWKPLVTKINQSSGIIEWSKRYSYPGEHTQLYESFKMQNNSLFLHGFLDLPSKTYQSLMIVDALGNILKLKMHFNPSGSMNYISSLASNSDILLSGNSSDYLTIPGGNYSTFVRLDSNLNIKYSKKTAVLNYASHVNIKEDQQGYVFVHGYNSYNNVYNADLFLKKYTYDGLLGTCPSDTFTIEEPILNFTVTDQGMNTIDGPIIPTVTVNQEEIVYSLQQNSFNCGSVNGCDAVWLTGPLNVCDSTNTYTFKANKNTGCTAPVNWIFNSAGIEVQEKNDSLIKLRFLKNGVFKIKAQLLTGCHIFEDSAETQIKISPSGVYLGPDTSLCPNNKLLLNAHPGFNSYLWQDGSFDSTFLITTPGNYFVNTTNDCGTVFNDTIIVISAPPISFDIGPDLSKCNDDSLTISAPTGFMNYTWSPNYNINSTIKQTVILFPSTDTIYNVSAEKTPGCFAYDSIRIKVNHSLVIDLGIDKSFCKGDSLALNPGSGFNSYQWNTGETSEQIFVHNAGLYFVMATDLQNCRSKDSIAVTVYNNPVVQLPKDSVICAGGNQQLDAGAGFSAYLWNNGSTSQTIPVNIPGTYWVRVTDNHNCKASDTTFVINALLIPFDVGPDLSKCNNDSLTISAPPGFISYIWSPDYNITSTAQQTVILFPSIDTMYKVTAEKTSGCFTRDSIRIKVNHSPVIDLGIDKSFCKGDSLALNPGSGFNSYQWNTGETSEQIFVHNAGLYFVMATDLQNCRSKDSIAINVYDNLVVQLPRDSLICAGSNQQLNAGAGFVDYLWNNGSTSQSIYVNAPGIYWVQVTDNHYCKGSDTTSITRLLAPPSKFLPADTAICTYSSIQLKPLSFYKNYLWSNGDVSENISISQPGLYWLQVTDNSNCAGTDTIMVNPKECLEGFYIPKAFTPNNDGKNDVFRPLLLGNVIKYRFIIYNRWGEKVFETTELEKGWDGNFNGIPQSSFVFIWQCFYQFSGSSPAFQKGTATLIR